MLRLLIRWTEDEKDPDSKLIWRRSAAAAAAAAAAAYTFWGNLKAGNRLWSLWISYRNCIRKNKGLNK